MRRVSFDLSSNKSKIAFAVYGENADFYIVKGIIENILEIANISRYQLERANEAGLHPGRSAEIFIGKDNIATFGEVHPQVLENWAITVPCVAGEIDLESIM